MAEYHIGHIYRHYKGQEYLLVDTAIHTETRNMLAIYKPLYECEYKLFARPLAMFLESVTIDGEEQPRFMHIGQYDQSS